MSNVQEQTPADKLTSLQAKIKEIENKRIGANKEIELLKEQYTELKKTLEELGISNLDDLPNLIVQLEDEFNQQLACAEKDVERIEQVLSANV
jgi:hypothetical protein